jgi:hypothetical protein
VLGLHSVANDWYLCLNKIVVTVYHCSRLEFFVVIEYLTTVEEDFIHQGVATKLPAGRQRIWRLDSRQGLEILSFTTPRLVVGPNQCDIL